jgi:hypothetical protein
LEVWPIVVERVENAIREMFERVSKAVPVENEAARVEKKSVDVLKWVVVLRRTATLLSPRRRVEVSCPVAVDTLLSAVVRVVKLRPT